MSGAERERERERGEQRKIRDKDSRQGEKSCVRRYIEPRLTLACEGSLDRSASLVLTLVCVFVSLLEEIVCEFLLSER